MYSYGAKEQQNTFGYHLQPKFRNTNNKNCDLKDTDNKDTFSSLVGRVVKINEKCL